MRISEWGVCFFVLLSVLKLLVLLIEEGVLSV